MFDIPSATLSDLPLLILAEAIVALAAILQASVGMGFGMLAAPLLALIDPTLVPGPMLVLGFVTAAIGALRERRGIDWGELRIGFTGRVVGAAAAVALLASLPDRSLFSLIFGLLVAFAIVLSVSGWKIAFTRVNLFALSTVSGLMGTITSVGAPPMALLYQHRDVLTARPTLNALFACGMIAGLAGLGLSGWIGWRDVGTAALLVPGMATGFYLSRYTARFVDRRFRHAALGLAFAAGVLLIVRGTQAL
ncbi:sulfite exporter TauE/SafE family protein [Polymorphum gilvum]|uniref:Probable membrane transporter protein n=1 Tax=Polymorphum gilvum (strain LMG 25793 / CGMCC 1.9160 / SL003B-26A1) TaxID=991905 RepID=F2J1G6_POLGS|nr:sulfite exporter TauE/SafE family protein [Polymorphum gilvum]ADZ69748.1 Conserved domain protein, putative [Polymorphum gilvum SL003B-26A1]